MKPLKVVTVLKLEIPMNVGIKNVLRAGFDRKLRFDFHGVIVTGSVVYTARSVMCLD